MTGNLKIVNINIDWSDIDLHDPDDPSVPDGANGRLIEDILERYGFPINRGSGTDLPGIEVKTKCTDKSSKWTIGRMTYTDIIKSSWENSTVRTKIQKQYQVLYAKNNITGTYKVTSAMVVDFTHPEIQGEMEAAYESCRKQMIYTGSSPCKSVTEGPFTFEYRPNSKGRGESYSFRISITGMKKLVGTGNALTNGLFEIL